jgi:hypothetical protein
MISLLVLFLPLDYPMIRCAKNLIKPGVYMLRILWLIGQISYRWNNK